MKWWLERHFPSLRFHYIQTKRKDQAIEAIVRFIDGGFPVLVSVSHERVAGHIILVTGYANYLPNTSNPTLALIVHDPYGSFDPTLLETLFGSRRWVGGASLLEGGQMGPGRGNQVPLPSVGRRRIGDALSGTYFLLSGSQ